MSRTTISVSTAHKDSMKQIGKMGDTMDDVLGRLLSVWDATGGGPALPSGGTPDTAVLEGKIKELTQERDALKKKFHENMGKSSPDFLIYDKMVMWIEDKAIAHPELEFIWKDLRSKVEGWFK